MLAEQGNVIVVYPFITSYDGFRSQNCCGFWFDQHIHRGAGEAEDLYQIAREVESRYNIDPNRRYITGLSSGSAMAVVMVVAYSDYFAAGGAVAGLPYFETSACVGFYCANPGTFKAIDEVVSAMKSEQDEPAEQRTIPFMTIHSINDCTVIKSHQKTSVTRGSSATRRALRPIVQLIARLKASRAPTTNTERLPVLSQKPCSTMVRPEGCQAVDRTIGSATIAESSPILKGPVRVNYYGISFSVTHSVKTGRHRLSSHPVQQPAPLSLSAVPLPMPKVQWWR